VQKVTREKGHCVTVSANRFHARQAAVALLKMAKTTSDKDLAANLVRVAADLKEQAGELPPRLKTEPPGVQAEE
jgi:fumarate hydratase class II